MHKGILKMLTKTCLLSSNLAKEKGKILISYLRSKFNLNCLRNEFAHINLHKFIKSKKRIARIEKKKLHHAELLHVYGRIIIIIDLSWWSSCICCCALRHLKCLFSEKYKTNINGIKLDCKLNIFWRRKICRRFVCHECVCRYKFNTSEKHFSETWGFYENTNKM